MNLKLKKNANSLIQSYNCITKRIYTTLKIDADNGVTYNNQNWAYQIKTILENLGLANYGLSKHHVTYLLLKKKNI